MGNLTVFNIFTCEMLARDYAIETGGEDTETLCEAAPSLRFKPRLF